MFYESESEITPHLKIAWYWNVHVSVFTYKLSIIKKIIKEIFH